MNTTAEPKKERPLPALIAIDGPSGAGKSTVGRLLAHRLGYRFLDTGLMYRAVTWLALQRGIPPQDEESMETLALRTHMEVPKGGRETIFIAGKELTTWELRSPQVEAGVSLASRLGAVRRALVAQQQRLALGGQLVMVGRDIGTVVLPKAELKIYLEASLQERAWRHYRALSEGSRSLEQVMEELRHRDEMDQGRANSPLRPAADAWVIDTEGLSQEEVMDAILKLCRD